MSISASAISRLLAKAGHIRAESETTSIRGYHHDYPGFTVSSASRDDFPDGGPLLAQVIVGHETHDSNNLRLPGDDGPTIAEVREEHLTRYEQTLHAAGYITQRGTGRYGTIPVIWVTGRARDRGRQTRQGRSESRTVSVEPQGTMAS